MYKAAGLSVSVQGGWFVHQCTRRLVCPSAYKAVGFSVSVQGGWFVRQCTRRLVCPSAYKAVGLSVSVQGGWFVRQCTSSLVTGTKRLRCELWDYGIVDVAISRRMKESILVHWGSKHIMGSS